MTHRRRREHKHLASARRYRNERDWPRAVDHLRMALKYDPTNTALYDELISLHKKTARPWGEAEMAESLTWEMERQALQNPELRQVHQRLHRPSSSPSAAIKKIGLTGGVACGKSTVLKEFAKLGIPTLSADQIVQQLLETSPTIQEKVQAEFGTLDRPTLAKLIFADPARRRRLEGILHPAVRAELAKQVGQLAKEKRPLVVMEVPLLFETDMAAEMDRVIVVRCSPQRQQEYARKRGFSKDDFLKRQRAQLPLATQCRDTDYIIDNSYGLGDLARHVQNLILVLSNQMATSASLS